jgi:hypothetical protein
MRIVNWLFLVSVMLFICGVGFVIAAARTSRTSRTVAPAGSDLAPPLVPVASIKQIMNGIVDPAAQRIYMSVGTNSTKNGIETYGPKTDDDWTKLGNDAAAIIESAADRQSRGRQWRLDQDDARDGRRGKGRAEGDAGQENGRGAVDRRRSQHEL